jgi:biopolymer transport protein TolQ
MKTTIEIIKMSLGDPVTIAVLLILAFFSLLVWGIAITKYLNLKGKQGANIKFYKSFDSVNHFAEVEQFSREAPRCPLKTITDAVLEEARNLSHFVSVETLAPRSEMLEDTIQREVEATRLEEDSNLSFLAIASNVSPFFGLFGTVWGIMQSFYEIGTHGSADLSVVAPGIAVALVTTVAGLVTAIPASVMFNYFVSRNNRQEILYYSFSSQLLSLFKRGDLLAIEKVLTERETLGR